MSEEYVTYLWVNVTAPTPSMSIEVTVSLMYADEETLIDYDEWTDWAKSQ